MPVFTLRAEGSDGLVVSSSVTVQASGVAGEVHTWAELAAKAADPASAGRTFHMRAGDYGTRTLSAAKPSQPVRFVGYPGEEAAVRFGALTLADCRNVTIDGFRATVEVNLRRCVDTTVRRARIGTADTDGYGVARTSSTLEGCTRSGFEQCDMTGALGFEVAYALNVDCYARGCSLHHPRQDCCWVWLVDGMTWEDCEFHHIVTLPPEHNDGIQLDADVVAQARVGRVTVRGCYFHDCTSQVFFARGGVMPSVVFENNLAVRCGGGFQSWAFFGCDGLTLRRNTGWDGGNVDMSLRQDPGGPSNKRLVIERNVCQKWNFQDPNVAANTLSRSHNVGASGFSPGSTDLVAVAKPPFLDPASDDYRLARPLAFADGSDTPGVDWRPADKRFGPGW